LISSSAISQHPPASVGISQRALEITLTFRRGRHRIHWSAPARVVQAGLDDPDHVVDVDPAHPLASVADSGRQSQLRGQGQSRENATITAEHQPDAQVHHAHSLGLGGVGRGLALHAKA
jgi:hypothetical protein